MAGRIILDTRLPADLDEEATAATGSDWMTIQKSGEDRLRRIRPLAAVPDLPASKTTSGTFSIDRIPSIPLSKLPEIVGIGSAAEANSGSLSSSFTVQTGATIGVTETTNILVMFWWAGSATRTSGTSQMGVEVQMRRSTTNISPVMYPFYYAGGAGTITIPTGDIGAGYPATPKTYTVAPSSITVGGAVTWWWTQSVAAGNTSFSIVARFITGTTSAARNNARVQIFALR